VTARLVEVALELGLTVGTPLDPARRGGAVTIDLGERTEAVGARLIADGILVDHRPGAGIRVGPHFFNTIEECDRLLGALQGFRNQAPASVDLPWDESVVKAT
jgi:kynureninase